MMNDITILIPTSPIPSHPDTDILDETISNTRKYTDAQIIIMFDGVHDSLAHRTEDYEEYKWNVVRNIRRGKYGVCTYRFFPHHRHQSDMTREVLRDCVRSSTIMFNEHDTSLINDIPFNDIAWLVKESNTINSVKFNIFEQIPKEHEYLMLDKEPELWNNIPLRRTIQWSQRPHIAKANWYRDLLYTYMEGKRCMIEDVMHSVVAAKYNHLGFDTFGLAIYTPPGNQLRSYHADARQHDEKIIWG